jgi:hypothetical protein
MPADIIDLRAIAIAQAWQQRQQTVAEMAAVIRRYSKSFDLIADQMADEIMSSIEARGYHIVPKEC